jgi:hypothetical protein
MACPFSIGTDASLLVTPPPMLFADPDYPHVVMAFTYRGMRLELDASEEDGVTQYAVWATHSTGYAIAVPGAISRTEAIYRAKRWVDQRLAPAG